jgi:galactose mutarotase-like enzyme
VHTGKHKRMDNPYGTSSRSKVTLIEKENVKIKDKDDNDFTIQVRIFEISLNDVRVELCSLGASITRIRIRSNHSGPNSYDDVVLGFDSIYEMYGTQNPAYFGVCTGRVTNRIKHGRFRTQRNGKEYAVAINDEPNHLHGGHCGLSRKNWQVDLNDQDAPKRVHFFYISDDGDQGYPGKVKVSAIYSMQPTPCDQSVKLCLTLTAELLDDTPSPINLTQHSYFNLAGHDSKNGILDHTLRLNCFAYTPMDEFSIPTRDINLLTPDCTMDWRKKRSIRQGLTDYGTKNVGRTLEQIQTELQRETPLPTDLKPYGFDHNYIVSTSPNSVNELSLVAVLQHANRRLTIRSTQPGVQLYTANYLDGSVPAQMKGSIESSQTKYHRWQGICLETQHFPDSILVENDAHLEFARGQCPILTPTSRHYRHSIEYTFENYITDTCDVISTEGFQGTDSDGIHYSSVEEMWSAQGWLASSSSSWYERAASYYDENCPTTIDGVLGGFASITELDIQGSVEFIQDLELIRPEITNWTMKAHKNPAMSSNGQKRRACECGAGIGRVSNGILLKLGGIEQCDLIESSATLLDAAPDYLGNTVAAKCRFFCTGLQDWQPSPNTYSIIWIQWVLSYLTDDDIIRFFRRCGESLVDDGLIILKENMCADGNGDDERIIDFEVDSNDASVTRSLRYWKYLIHQSGLRIVYEKIQDGFPDEIYPVPMLALDVCPTLFS